MIIKQVYITFKYTATSNSELTPGFKVGKYRRSGYSSKHYYTLHGQSWLCA
jgi:hypothetical protein